MTPATARSWVLAAERVCRSTSRIRSKHRSIGAAMNVSRWIDGTVTTSPAGRRSSRTVDVRGASCPRDGLDRLLQILLSPADIAERRVQRIVAHELGQAMERHRLSHAVAEAMPKVVW